MSHFDDLPRRDGTHELEEAAIVAFQTKLAECGIFIRQGADRKDYGTDCQIEVIDDGQATNVRLHVQLKGTERALNADGSLSIEVRSTNLNYLLMQPYSIYVCYHVPSGSLLIRPVASVLRQYEHDGKPWTEQDSLTVTFTDKLTVEHQQRLSALARSGAICAPVNVVISTPHDLGPKPPQSQVTERFGRSERDSGVRCDIGAPSPARKPAGVLRFSRQPLRTENGSDKGAGEGKGTGIEHSLRAGRPAGGCGWKSRTSKG
jgi:hypothetical protein